MKKVSFEKVSRFIAAFLCTTMCVTAVHTITFAETTDDEKQISIVMYNDFLCEETLERCNEMANESLTVNSEPTMIESAGSLARDAGYPRKSHDLSSAEYHYDGSTTNLNLYTLTYYKPTADGEIFLEGMGTTQTHPIHNDPLGYRNLVIDIYDKDTNQCLASFPLSTNDILHNTDDHTDFFYRFAIINLNPNKDYFIGFRGDQEPFTLEVEGYIAHDWTYHYDY